MMRSLKSRGVVDEVFNWRHHYFSVKTEGLKVLRDALGIVEQNIVPITFKKTKKDHMGKEEGKNKISDEDKPRGERRGRGDRSKGARGGRVAGRAAREEEAP
jgi:small subunit ribosomal protein S10e